MYKELTDMHHVTTGSVAKHYYERSVVGAMLLKDFVALKSKVD